jgi:hypothetical protein
MSGDPLDLELATTALLADHHDLRELLKMLARQLAGTLGPRCEVEREGRFLRKSDEVKCLRVRIGDEEFIAEVRQGQVGTSIGHDSGGIRIRTEKIPTDEWLNRLLQELQREAASNQASRMAIENLVMGGRS